jgi:hypothetical protein
VDAIQWALIRRGGCRARCQNRLYYIVLTAQPYINEKCQSDIVWRQFDEGN